MFPELFVAVQNAADYLYKQDLEKPIFLHRGGKPQTCTPLKEAEEDHEEAVARTYPSNSTKPGPSCTVGATKVG